MHRKVLLAVCLCLAATALSPFAQAEGENYTHTPPKHLTIHKHFKPDATASGARLAWIADQEQRRWGGPSIKGRIACESTMNSRATNGTYDGPLQFGPIWYSMYPGTPRDVTVKTRRTRKRPIYTLQNGVRHRLGTVRQHQKVILHGKLPRRASAFHAWAAVRVGQRAVSGDGPSTGWACGL